MHRISGIIIARDEEKHISRAIRSLAHCCDEIIVADTGSCDTTKEVSTRLGARVINLPFRDSYSTVRNRAIVSARHDLILFLDADEELDAQLQQQIAQLKLTAERLYNYRLRRRDHFWGTDVTHGEVWQAAQQGVLRLFWKDSGAFRGNVHEVFHSMLPEKLIPGAIVHRSHTSIAGFLEKVNRYSTLRADELIAAGKHVTLIELVCVPLAKFFYTYVFYLGFRDGTAGFVYSFMMSFHSFLVRAKVMLHSI